MVGKELVKNAGEDRCPRYLPSPMCRQVTLRLHAASLASPFDTEGEVVLSQRDIATLFCEDNRGVPTLPAAFIRTSVEHVLPRTGHMFRSTHPATYSRQATDFVIARTRATQCSDAVSA
jgi:hypothetical protein